MRSDSISRAQETPRWWTVQVLGNDPAKEVYEQACCTRGLAVHVIRGKRAIWRAYTESEKGDERDGVGAQTPAQFALSGLSAVHDARSLLKEDYGFPTSAMR